MTVGEAAGGFLDRQVGGDAGEDHSVDAGASQDDIELGAWPPSMRYIFARDHSSSWTAASRVMPASSRASRR